MQSEQQLRHSAAERSLRIVKVRESSPDYPQYGPYCLVDARLTGSSRVGWIWVVSLIISSERAAAYTPATLHSVC